MPTAGRGHQAVGRYSKPRLQTNKLHLRSGGYVIRNHENKSRESFGIPEERKTEIGTSLGTPESFKTIILIASGVPKGQKETGW